MLCGMLCILRKIRKSSSLINIRSFLSDSFNLNDTWNNRLNSQTINKVNLEALYYDLDSQYSKTRKVSPIDVDIFLNGLTDDTYITEAEELVHRLRTTAETHKTLPTTHHAVIRLFITANKIDNLTRILNDRLNYGIFPDDYCYLYMIDYFLKRKDYKNAAKVSVLPMLQEDFSHPLVKQFALYSVHNYVLNHSPWDETKAEDENNEEDDEEEIKIRVKYIRNPFFDDHFDLTDPNHICGKTLYMIGNTFNNSVGKSYCIMGLALYNKWEKLDKYLSGLLNSTEGLPIYSESIHFAENIVNEKCTSNDLHIVIKEKLNRLSTVNVKELSLVKIVENDLKQLVLELEAVEIEKQKKLYSEWESFRDAELGKYLAELDKINRMQTIQTKKDELAKKEQLLYYFDNEEQIELIVEKKSETLRKRAEGEAKRKKKLSEITEETYVPPEVKKRETVKD